MAPEFVFAHIEPGQQSRVINRYPEIRFAGAAITATEFEGNLLNRFDLPTNENLEKQLEAGALESNLVEAMTADHEEAGHGIFSPKTVLLKRPCDPDSRCRKQFSGWIPLPQPAARSVAASDYDVPVVQHSG